MKPASKLRLPGWYKGGFELTKDNLRNLDLFVDNQFDYSEFIRKGLYAKCDLKSLTQLDNLAVEKISHEGSFYYVWVKDASLFSRLSDYFSTHLSSSRVEEVWRREKSSRAHCVASATVPSQMPGSDNRVGYRPIILQGLGSNHAHSTRYQNTAIQKSTCKKFLVRSTIVGAGGGTGYLIGKACVTTAVSAGTTASLFIALCTLGGAALFLLVAYYCVPRSCCYRFFSSASIGSCLFPSNASPHVFSLSSTNTVNGNHS
jgi:hypothetical protein